MSNEDLHKQEPGDRRHTNGGVSQHLPPAENTAEELRRISEKEQDQ